MTVTNVEPLEIQVETDVLVPSGTTSRKVVDALRRHLRQHKATADALQEDAQRRLLSLLETRGGQHRMPQGLLPKVTDTCRRYGVPYAVVDRRAMVSCPALRSQIRLSDPQREALRHLLLRDSGVLISDAEENRQALAIELVARRQQRTLVATEADQQEHWVDRMRASLGLPDPQVRQLEGATGDTWIAVGPYQALLDSPDSTLRQDFGMVVCDGVSSVDALTLMRVIRSTGARYLMGLADDAVREDGLHGPIFTALGGIAHRLTQPQASGPLRLECRFSPTDFCFSYKGRQQYQALVAALASDAARTRQIAVELTRQARAGHPCLVLSERKDHLEHLASCLPTDLSTATITSAVGPVERSRIISSFDRGEVMVLLATSQIAVESITTPRVRRLFLTFPFSYARKLERVVRFLLQPSDDKQDAILFDYDDAQVDPLHRAFVKRKKVLTKLRRESEARRQLELPMTR
jgi:superfamily II DNA or RNA helicase